MDLCNTSNNRDYKKKKYVNHCRKMSYLHSNYSGEVVFLESNLSIHSFSPKFSLLCDYLINAFI